MSRRSMLRGVTVFGLLSACALGSGCRVPPPTVQQVLQIGYLTPEQAYTSWRTAIQGNLLVQEYQSLSKDWRKRHGGVSLFTYSEIRDALLEEKPLLRFALGRVEPAEVIAANSVEVTMQARIPGLLWVSDHWLYVKLVREGFSAVHLEDLPDRAMYGNRDIDVLGTKVLSSRSNGDQTLLEARVQVPTVTDEGTEWPQDVVLLQVGWEWKIDAFDVLPEPIARGESARR